MSAQATGAGSVKSGRVWAVLVGCCVIMAVGFSVPMTIVSVLVPSLAKGLKSPFSQVMLYFTAVTLANIVLSPFAPKLLAKLGAGKCIGAGAVVVGGMLIAMSRIGSASMLVPIGAVIGLCLPFLMLPVPILINNWFKKKTGTMTGIAMSCAGIGAAILSPIVTSLVATQGWRAALVVVGVVVVVCIVPFAAFALRLNPADVGVLPYGVTAEDMAAMPADPAAARKAMQAKAPGLMLKQAVKMPAFYLVLLAALTFGYVGSLNTSVAAIVQTSGFAVALVGTVVSVQMLGTVVGKIIIGVVKDRFGAVIASVYAFLMAAAGLALYLFAIKTVSVPLLFAGAVVGGLGTCLATILPPLVTADAFGGKDYGSIYGIVAAIGGLGGAVASPLLASIYDATHSYAGSVLSMLVVALVAIPVVVGGIKLGQSKWKAQVSKKASAAAEPAA